MQPFAIAKLQAKIIEHDEDRMFDVLEGFTWDFEKVWAYGQAQHNEICLSCILIVRILLDISVYNVLVPTRCFVFV